jgi:hypothetical protein
MSSCTGYVKLQVCPLLQGPHTPICYIAITLQPPQSELHAVEEAQAAGRS